MMTRKNLDQDQNSQVDYNILTIVGDYYIGQTKNVW